MIAVSDTTPIILVMKVGQLELLQKLFGVICIPDSVYRELIENEGFPEETRRGTNAKIFYDCIMV